MNRIIAVVILAIVVVGCGKSDKYKWSKLPIPEGKITLLVPQPTDPNTTADDEQTGAKTLYLTKFADGNSLKCIMRLNSLPDMTVEKLTEVTLEMMKPTDGPSSLIGTNDILISSRIFKAIAFKNKNANEVRRIVYFGHDGKIFLASAIGSEAFVKGPLADKFFTSITLD